MSDYAKLNIKQDVENAALSFGMGDDLEARFARKALGLEQFGFSLQKLRPNYRQPFGHRHGGQEEVYLVLGGSGRVKVGEEILDLRPWDALRVSPDTTRQFESGDDGLELLVIGGTPSGDAETVEGWWSD
jgi:mannose-6-phosphate isomerase-like protein (cupin superfamily)